MDRLLKLLSIQVNFLLKQTNQQTSQYSADKHNRTQSLYNVSFTKSKAQFKITECTNKQENTINTQKKGNLMDTNLKMIQILELAQNHRRNIC